MSVEILRMKNTGDVTIRDMFAGVPYIVEPGGSTIVPWDAFTTWYGDPALVDRPTMARYDRRDEIQRVKTRQGIAVAETEGRVLAPPSVAFETLEGEPVLTLLQDPSGDRGSIRVADIKNLDSAEAVATELETLKRQQIQLLEQLNNLQNAQSAPSLDDLDEDVPTKVPVSGPPQ